MTTSDRFDRDLATWLSAETTVRAPAGLHAAAIDQARRGRQRPGWLVDIRGGTIRSASARTVDRRAMTVLAIVVLLLAGLLAAIVAGALRTNRLPLGANGPIEFTYQGNNHGPGGTRRVNADGTDDQPVRAGGGCPRFSRDGSVRVTATGDSLLTTLLVTDMSTGKAAKSVSAQNLDDLWHPHFGSYDVSPDGSRIAWLRSLDVTVDVPARELMVSRLDDGSTRLVVPAAADPAAQYGMPVWSPDGRSVAYETWTAGPDGGYGVRSGIAVVDVDTRAVRQVSSRGGATVADLSWSPDGQWLAFIGQPDGVPIPPPDAEAEGPDPRSAGDVFVVRADGTDERNLTSSAAFEQGTTWAPDGTRLGYLSSEHGDNYRLTILAMDGPTPTRGPAHGPVSAFMVWSPDGQQLLWVDGAPLATGSGSSNTIHAIDRDLAGPSSAITTVEGSILCAPSWAAAARP